MSRHRHGGTRSLARIFAAPALVAMASLVGLVTGLTGDGVSDLLSWALLSLPVAVIVRAWLSRA